MDLYIYIKDHREDNKEIIQFLPSQWLIQFKEEFLHHIKLKNTYK